METDFTFDNTFRTQYLIWANDAAKETLGSDFCGEGGTFSPCFLMMKLFDACGWTGDSNMAAMRELYEKVDVVHDKFYRKNDEYIWELPEDTQALVDQYKKFEYYRVKDAMR